MANTYPIQHYIERRDECMLAAAKTKLPNAKKRHLEAATAWQQIIDQLGNRLGRVKDPA